MRLGQAYGGAELSLAPASLYPRLLDLFPEVGGKARKSQRSHLFRLITDRHELGSLYV
jgi:hypothetical protein